MIRMRRDPATGLSVPELLCGWCERPIEDAGLAAAAWFCSARTGEPDSAWPRFAHKGACLDAIERYGLAGERHRDFRWQELSYFLIELGEAIRLDWESAAALLGVPLARTGT